eukprot:COSAG06_NODE_4274_length_4412_cov_9.270345_2_plen_152_part_00
MKVHVAASMYSPFSSSRHFQLARRTWVARGCRSRTSRPAGSVSARPWKQDIELTWCHDFVRQVNGRYRAGRGGSPTPPPSIVLRQYTRTHAQANRSGDSRPRCGLPRISRHECKCFFHSAYLGEGANPPPIQSAANHPPRQPSRQVSRQLL